MSEEAPRPPADARTNAYFDTLISRVHDQVELAQRARATGFDVHSLVECIPVTDLADRTEKLAGPAGVAKRFREILETTDRNKGMFKLFREIVMEEGGWYTNPDMEKRVEQGIKTCLVIMTEGVVVAPLDGLPYVKLAENPDGSKYVDIYFAGPIRAAGASAAVLPLILGDYAQKLLNLGRYQPTTEEIERYAEEVYIYQTDIISRQIKMTMDELRIIAKGCPVCVNGIPTEDTEIVVHRNLPRVPSNRVRGGMCLVITEGLGLKALKVLSWAKQLELDWSFLEKIIKVEKKADQVVELKPNWKYLEGVAAGRPLIAYPSEWGGFRLRYGRSRNTGCAGKGINPALMYLLDEFIAVGTHVRIERPGKAAQLFPVETIDGPTVLLKDGSMRQINTIEDALLVRPLIEKIFFVGDMLVTLGDYRKAAHPLTPSPFVPEWWVQLVKKEIGAEKKTNVNVQPIVENPFAPVSVHDAITLSQDLGVPLHPSHTWFYKGWSREEAKQVIDAIRAANDAALGLGVLRLPLTPTLKKRFEHVGLPHHVHHADGAPFLLVDEKVSEALRLFTRNDVEPIQEEDTSLSLLSRAAGIPIWDKVGTFSGGRMGRPEAACPRTMKGNPHVLFPIGLAGGATRSMNRAAGLTTVKGKPTAEKTGKVDIEIALFECPTCHELGAHRFCVKCHTKTIAQYVCTNKECLALAQTAKCPQCGFPAKRGGEHSINIRTELEWAAKNLSERIPEPVKGVKGLISDEKTAEPLEKGILRAKHDLHVFRDGTMRFELLNAPLTHFYPNELGLTIEKAKELGYTHDAQGNPLERDDQMVEMFVQDIVVNEGCGDWLLRCTQYIDDLLVKFYKLPAYYHAKTKEDIIGHLVIGLAPHTSAGITARVIGYTKTRLGWGHPYFIMCKRRNCLPGNTPVLIQNGNQLKSVPISTFDDGTDREEIPLENVLTYTIDEKGELKMRKVNALLKQKSPPRLLKFKTRFGREITTTPNHELLTFDGKKVIKKLSSEFKKGENLLSLHSIHSTRENDTFNVLEFYLKKPLTQKKLLRVHGLKEELTNWIKRNEGYSKTARRIGYPNWKKIHTAVDFDSVPLDLFELVMKDMKKKPAHFKNCKIGYNKQKSTIPAIISFNKELGEIVGYYLADGYARTSRGKREKFVYQVNFVSDERPITARLHQSIQRLFGRNATIERKKIDLMTLSGRVYYEFFTEMLGTGNGAKTKRVPPLLLNAPNECIEGLLSGYIVGDGHINANSIKMTSVNQALINDFGLVCNRLGLFPHFINEKERKIKSGKVHDYYAKRGKEISIHAYGIRLYSDDLKAIGTHLFGKKAEKFGEIMQTHLFRKKRLKKIGNFALDPVVEIKTIPSNEKWVYDLMVEGEKNYIAGFGNLAVYDCDGDQDSVMLLMDALLNFSHSYLSHSRGGRMDAPLVFTLALNPQEIDDEVYEMETTQLYPISMYEKTLVFSEPKLDEVPVVKKKLGKEDQFTGLIYSHITSRFDRGPTQSSYTKLKTMEEKLNAQAKLQSRLVPLQFKDSLERVIVSHLFPDIIGNTRAFSRQTFRCTKCNAKYRRIPLTGNCQKCTGGNIILTIAEGGVRKYLTIAKNMIYNYDLSEYLKQRINLAETEINAVFPPEKQTQKSLFEFA